MFSSDKQKEIAELLTDFGAGHVSAIWGYKVEFFESGENVITKFSAIEPVRGKEILNIQNIMTPEGFKNLENTKGWNTWALEQCEVMKGCAERKPKESWFKRLFGLK